MQKALAEIRRLLETNAEHRKGYRLGEVSKERILEHAKEELNELIAEQDDVVEMADVLAILFQYCQVQGWSMETLETIMLIKMKIRFKRSGVSAMEHLTAEKDLRFLKEVNKPVKNVNETPTASSSGNGSP